MIELERTFLAKYLPTDLDKCHKKEILDIYYPFDSVHPVLRFRKKGGIAELTKKFPVEEWDASHQHEFTIELDDGESKIFEEVRWKRVRKMRYYYDYKWKVAEFDVFLDDLSWLVLIDFEFSDLEEKEQFSMPDFCLVEVTQEKFIAGGMVCGKTYDDIFDDLETFEYKRLFVEE